MRWSAGTEKPLMKLYDTGAGDRPIYSPTRICQRLRPAGGTADTISLLKPPI
ncbi:hypothetical protein [Ruminococcus albus]|uniref:hypothetical protein n=1 Tax=Ruminococcus albus TaxID=1264 RepID=UPI0004B6A9F0|nr:hypothetical protein [Ruminococcus albus]